MNTSTIAGTMAGMLLAASVHAQTTANTPPIGQAVSGQNSTAAGTSGTGLHRNGTATTRSPHGDVGRQAAGVNAAGQVAAKSTAVINPAPGQADNVNAQATNTTAPDSKAPGAKATGGRGQTGTRAEQEVMKADARAVKEVPGDRMKAESATKKKGKRKAKQAASGS